MSAEGMVKRIAEKWFDGYGHVQQSRCESAIREALREYAASEWVDVRTRKPCTAQWCEILTKGGNVYGPATLGMNADDEIKWSLKNGAWVKPEHVSHWKEWHELPQASNRGGRT